MDISDDVRGFTIDLEARNRSPNTITTYLKAAHQFIAFLEAHEYPTDVHHIEPDHLREHLASLTRNRAAATAVQRFSWLQPFFLWLVEEGELDVSPMTRLKKPTIPDNPSRCSPTPSSRPWSTCARARPSRMCVTRP